MDDVVARVHRALDQVHDLKARVAELEAAAAYEESLVLPPIRTILYSYGMAREECGREEEEECVQDEGDEEDEEDEEDEDEEDEEDEGEMEAEDGEGDDEGVHHQGDGTQ